MKWLVVGAGLTGATLANCLADSGENEVVVIDQRPHVGGNAYDENDEAGILVHRYGPHIFHTNSPKVFEYLSKFTNWRPYEHRVRAQISTGMIPLPFNLAALSLCFPKLQAARIEAALVKKYGAGCRVPILKLRQEDDIAVREFADFVYREVFEGYTLKQWGTLPERLLPSVTARVPVVLSHDDRYFDDQYQVMPAGGYTRMVQSMLQSRKITVLNSTPWDEYVREHRHFDRVLFTGCIDQYYNYRLGPLPYRSVEFRFDNHLLPKLQDSATINYPEPTVEHTRTTEFKFLTGQKSLTTTVVTEIPTEFEVGRNLPYYPIPMEANNRTYLAYAELAKLEQKIVFCGRLGHYRYYNMDQAVGSALKVVSGLLRLH